MTDDPAPLHRRPILPKMRPPNIIKVGEERGMLFIAMQLVDGQTLGRLLEVEGALPLERALAIVQQIAAALDYAHGPRVIHWSRSRTDIVSKDRDRRLATTPGPGAIAARTWARGWKFPPKELEFPPRESQSPGKKLNFSPRESQSPLRRAKVS